MHLIVLPALAAVTLLAACSEASEEAADASVQSLDIAEPSTPRMVSAEAPSGSGESSPGKFDAGDGLDAQSVGDVGRPPQIAYVYDYGFRLAGDKIAPLQQRHADLCEAKGPYVCRIISMAQAGDEGEYGSGTLELAVVSAKARAFGKELTKAAEDSDGEQINAAISGEDLAKQIVDTEARLRARKLLRDRLMEVLATRRGTVTELVEAERGVAQVNEEIDQATSWLSEMQGRVAFSRVSIAYTSGAPSAGGFLEPIRDAAGNVGSILGSIIAMLILVLAVGVPLLLLGLLGRFGWVKAKLGLPSLRRASNEAAA